MPQLSLTDFVDIVSASGTPKATKVRRLKKRSSYDPAADCYKRIREAIIEVHQVNQEKAAIDRTLIGLTDPKKVTAYPVIVAGYKKWWGRKHLVWFEPPNLLYSKHGVSVAVNPELGLMVDGTPHLVKLYFKTPPLVKNRLDIITHLMAITILRVYKSQTPPVMSVLDVRRGKLISPTVPISGLSGMLDAELAYIASLWASE